MARGRPSLLSDPERKQRILRAFEDSMEKCLPVATACELAGISEATYYGWMSAGEEGVEPYSDFFETVTQARARGEQGMVDVLHLAALQKTDAEGNATGAVDWKAAAWLLERRFPDRYGQGAMARKAEEKALGVLLERLREGLDPATWARCLAILADEDGAGSSGERSADVH